MVTCYYDLFSLTLQVSSSWYESLLRQCHKTLIAWWPLPISLPRPDPDHTLTRPWPSLPCSLVSVSVSSPHAWLTDPLLINQPRISSARPHPAGLVALKFPVEKFFHVSIFLPPRWSPECINSLSSGRMSDPGDGEKRQNIYSFIHSLNFYLKSINER